MQDRYISASEIAKMLNISRGTVYNMRRNGDLPPGVKIGGNVRRWSLTKLNAFLTKGGITA